LKPVTSLSHYGIYNSCKIFYDTGQGVVFKKYLMIKDRMWVP